MNWRALCLMFAGDFFLYFWLVRQTDWLCMLLLTPQRWPGFPIQAHLLTALVASLAVVLLCHRKLRRLEEEELEQDGKLKRF